MRVSALFVVLLCGACRHYKASAPDGFAPFKDDAAFRAASPDGVVYRVRQEPNKPEADLAFWKEALKNRMRDAGYTFQREAAIQAGAASGYMIALSAPAGPVDYAYIVTIFVSGSKVVIAEAAGDVQKLEAHKPAILAAVAKLEID